MPNNISHFAIHADDPERAKRFYTEVFGWQFRPWGPPDFWMIQTSEEPGIHGSLQKRQHPKGEGMRGFECTISVDSVDETTAQIEANGGRIVTPKTQIPTVGWVVQFEDPEGNLACIMRYE